jgi:hypothetical protein
MFRGPDSPGVDMRVGGEKARLTRAEATRVTAVEARMDRVAQAANARGTQILTMSDTCVVDLQQASGHLRQVAQNYRSAHDKFTAVLKLADKEYEFDKSISDAIQGVAVAAALAVVLPEALAAAAVMATARALVASSSRAMTRAGMVIAKARAAVPAAGAEAAAAAEGEVAEIGTGAIVGQTRADTGRPSDSAALAGPSAADKLGVVLDHLSRLIDAIPTLGALGNSQRDLGFSAVEIARLGARLRAGDQVDLLVEELESQAVSFEDVDRSGAAVMGPVATMVNRLLIVKNLALAVRLETAEAYEDQLWTRWMASLITEEANEILDNDEIEKYLGPRGKKLFDFGSYTFDSEQREAVTGAQRRWLAGQGIDPGKDSAVTLSKYKGYTRLEQVRAKVTGRRGRLTDPRHIEIDGEVFDYPSNAGAFPAGTEMTALHVIIKPHLQGDVMLDNWRNDSFDVYCNPVE